MPFSLRYSVRSSAIFFGKGGYQNPFAFENGFAAFFHQVVNLVFNRTNNAYRVGQTGRTDNLFNKNSLALFHFPVAGRSGNEDCLRPHPVPFFQLEGAIVETGRQPPSIFGKGALAIAVTAVHAADLRYRDVAFVNKQQSVRRQVFKQSRRRFAGVHGRSGSASSFRCLCNGRWFQAFPNQNGCVVPVVAPRAICCFRENRQVGAGVPV